MKIMLLKTAKFLGWIIFGPIVWLILSIFMAGVVAVALFQLAANGRPNKTPPQKNFGLTPPDKSIIVLN